jgi:hypothetical protein
VRLAAAEARAAADVHSRIARNAQTLLRMICLLGRKPPRG